MKYGYACQNTHLKLTTNRTFRLASYSEEKLIDTVKQSLIDLQTMLAWNVEQGFMFFRIGSQIVPFASHPVCKLRWDEYFKCDLAAIGKYIKKHDIRISMHPDQFVIINAKDGGIVERSIAELDYHSRLLEAMGLLASAKMQIHVGGVYGDKPAAIKRFISTYKQLPKSIRKRLVIENDDRLFSVQDCLQIHDRTGIPVIFDNLHHQCLNNGENMIDAMQGCFLTWKKTDGVPMVDYSEQMPKARSGNHIDHVDMKKYKLYREATRNFEFDMMLEIKDKETSALLIRDALTAG